jgi:AcrR family transcriptional regulator
VVEAIRVTEDCVMAKTRPRDRIAGAARDLFHKHGIRGIGVDAIAEAAGTNKMTLYRHFGSKDDLIVQCMRDIAVEADGWWKEMEADFPGDPVGQLHAWVRGCAECIEGDDRGCSLANAAIELAETDHPARRVIEEIKVRQRARLVDLCKRAGIGQGDMMADALWLLLEGARVTRQSMGVVGPSARFIEICDAIIASFLAAGPEAARREWRDGSRASPHESAALASA